jgi:hypothetical protein
MGTSGSLTFMRKPRWRMLTCMALPLALACPGGARAGDNEPVGDPYEAERIVVEAIYAHSHGRKIDEGLKHWRKRLPDYTAFEMQGTESMSGYETRRAQLADGSRYTLTLREPAPPKKANRTATASMVPLPPGLSERVTKVSVKIALESPRFATTVSLKPRSVVLAKGPRFHEGRLYFLVTWTSVTQR